MLPDLYASYPKFGKFSLNYKNEYFFNLKFSLLLFNIPNNRINVILLKRAQQYFIQCSNNLDLLPELSGFKIFLLTRSSMWQTNLKEET